MWSNLLKKTAIGTIFYFAAEQENVCIYKKKIGKCKKPGPQSSCELFVTHAVIFIGKDSLVNILACNNLI